MPDRDTRAHSSTSSTVSSGQLPPTPCVLRQSDILMMLNIVHLRVDAAEHVNLAFCALFLFLFFLFLFFLFSFFFFLFRVLKFFRASSASRFLVPFLLTKLFFEPPQNYPF